MRRARRVDRFLIDIELDGDCVFVNPGSYQWIDPGCLVHQFAGSAPGCRGIDDQKFLLINGGLLRILEFHI